MKTKQQLGAKNWVLSRLLQGKDVLQTSVGVSQIKDKMSQSSMRENKDTAEKREDSLYMY